MAITVGSGAYANFVSNNGSTNTYFFYTTYSGNDAGAGITTRNFTISGYGTWSYNVYTTAASGSWYTSLSANPSGIPMDTTISWYSWLHTQEPANYFSSTAAFKSYVIAATSSAPSVSSITSSTASVNCSYVPNVTESVASAQLQYKRTVDLVWINFGTPGTTGGYSSTSVGATALTGLTYSTSYDVRLVITRTTSANTTTTSAVTSFTTLVGAPTVTTNTVSSVSNSSAQLNATAVVNAGTTMQVYWYWDTNNPPVNNITSFQAITTDGAYSLSITGLTPSTTYYAKAYLSYVTPSGSPATGSVVSFTTAADPAAEAASEDHMLVFDYDAKYGAAASFVFSAPLPSATSSNGLYTGAAVWSATAAEELILIDGALSTVVNADGRATNAATQISGPYYTITLTAAELSGELVQVFLHDSGAAVRDVLIRIRTKQRLGQVIVDAAALTNSNAVTYTGVGTGHGLSCVGGATGLDIDGFIGQMIIRTGTAQAGGAATITLDASASATNDLYNGQIVTIVSGTGAGQSRVITDYVGATQVSTVDSAWATNPDNTSVFLLTATSRDWYVSPGAELSAIPTFASSYATMLQFLWQRFTYKRTQTATVFTMTKVDDSTALGTAGVSDNGTTETHNRIS